MITRWLLPIVAFGLPSTGSVLAGDAGPVPLPEVKLESKADGAAQLSVKLGFVRQSRGSDWNMQPALTYSAVTRNGVAQLFQVTGDTIGVARDWALGANFTFGLLTHSKRSTQDAELSRAAQTAGYDRCAERCMPAGDVTDDDKKFCGKWRMQVAQKMSPQQFCSESEPDVLALDKKYAGTAVPQRKWFEGRGKALDTCLAPCETVPVDPSKTTWCATTALSAPSGSSQGIPSDDFCPAGQSLFDSLNEVVVERTASSFPRALINLGARVGQSRFTSVATSPSSDGTLPRLSIAPATAKTGLTAIYIPSDGQSTTLEGLFNFSADWEASTDTVHYCRPVAANVADDAHPGGDPGQICQDATYGAPTRSNRVTGGFFVGWIDQANAVYRLSAGAILDLWVLGQTKDRAQLTFQMPATVALFRFKGINYQGIVQIGPSIGAAWHRKGGSDLTFGLTASFSLQNYLFSQEFDHL